MKKLLFILLASSFIALYSCSGDNNDPNDPQPNNPTTAIMNINVNGVDYVINDFDNSLVIFPSGSMTSHRMDLRFLIDSIPTDIVLGNYGFQNPPSEGVVAKIYDTNYNDENGPNTECSSLDGFTYCDNAGAFYDIGTITYSTLFVDGTGYNVTISECNSITHKVSGSFDFMMAFFTQADTLHCVGTFENLEYQVFQ